MTKPRFFDILPAPPENLNSYARKSWLKNGTRLLDENRLTNFTIEELKNLCFWEQRKSELFDKLNSGNVPGIPVKPGPGTAEKSEKATLKSLKAVQKEIDAITSALRLDDDAEQFPSGLPAIPADVHDAIPGLLKNCCSLISGQTHKDLFLLSSLAASAAHLTGVTTSHAGGNITPDLHVIAISEKGNETEILALAEKLLSALNKAAVKEKKRAVIPPEGGKKLASTVLEHVIARGGDSTFIGSSWSRHISGNDDFSHLLATLIEKSFFNQSFSYVADRGPGYFEGMKISSLHHLRKDHARTFLTGNEGTIIGCVAMYGFDEAALPWSFRPPISVDRLHQQVGTASERLADLNQKLSVRKHELRVSLTDDQWQLIDDTFSEKLEIVEHMDASGQLSDAVKSMVLIALKIMMVLAVVRQYEQDPGSFNRMNQITPAAEDMFCALWIGDTLIKHSIRFISTLDVEGATEKAAATGIRGERYSRFLNTLPLRFETSDAIETANTLGIPVRTAKRYLKELSADQKIMRIQRGLYQKVL